MTPSDDCCCEPTTTADCPQHNPEPEMPYFVGVKVIQARPMTRHQFFGSNVPRITVTEEDEPGYLVRYPDGYESWSPARAFEDACFEMANKDEADDLAAQVKAILLAAQAKAILQ